jgi:hypothetical protein
VDVDVTSWHDGVRFRALQNLSRCRWQKKRSLSANAWLFLLLNLMNGFGERQLAEVRHVFF